MMNYQNPRGKNKAYARNPVSQYLVVPLLRHDTPDLTPLRI